MFGKKISVGLDLGDRWIKLVALTKSGSSISLFRVGRFLVSNQDKKDDLAGKLKLFFQTMDLKRVKVISSVGQSVIIKRVTFQAGDEEELGEVVSQQAKEHIPFDIQDIILDYHIISKIEDKKEFEVYLVACKKEYINARVKLFEKAGLNITCLDVDVFAFVNAFEFNYPRESKKAVYLLDIGEKRSFFGLYYRGDLIAFRDLDFGGSKLTGVIASTLNISFEEAEQVKMNKDIGLSLEQEKDVLQRLESEVQSWVLELKKMVSFYKTTYPPAKDVSTLFLAGGCSFALSQKDLFADAFDVSVEYLDPWFNIKKEVKSFDYSYLKAVKTQMVTATGLALRGLI
ncbi:MAG: type IV pilus assembly protein PilM [Desulfonauticus sp.]|nr:type IV pilus assembly protein PilM [Desulfonauticus sp.]